MDEVIGIQATRALLRENAQRARCLYVQRGRRDARMNELISMAKYDDSFPGFMQIF